MMDAARDTFKELYTLAEQLANEPFCRKYQLERQSLAKVSLFMEQRDSSLERVAPEQESLKESFGKFKAIYCLFLMQLEQLGTLDAAKMNAITLADYLSPSTLEQLGIGQGSGPDVEEVTAINVVAPKRPPMAPPLQPQTDTEPPAMPEGTPPYDGTEVTMIGNIINFVQPPKPTQEEGAVNWDAPVQEVTNAIDPPAPIAAPTPAPEPPAPVEPPRAAAPPPAAPPPPAPPPSRMPPPPAAAAAPPPAPAPQPEPAPTEVKTQPATPAAQEYFAMAMHFPHLRKMSDPSIPPHHLLRLEAQQLCFAIEMEFQEKLVAAAVAMWPERKNMLTPMFVGGSMSGELHPLLVKAWEALVSGMGIWPSDERLPILTLKNSLRFLGTSSDPEPLTPSLMEAGLWIYLLGQHVDLGGLILPNALNMPNFEYAVFGDAFLRLCRVHRLKGALLNPSIGFTETERSELENHAAALFAFSQAWTTN